ncbi:MAG: glycosyltransferase family 4 protein [Clostridiales bacterium]|nr:glycosyltransferase family 4 protein [Clostridiales bacterium]
MKRIYIVAHFCSDFTSKGNNRFNYLASKLSESGYEVHFFTTDFSHVKKQKRILSGFDLPYKVHFLHEMGYRKNVSIQRILSHKEFAANLEKALSSLELPDAVYLAVPSVDAAFKTAKYCVKNNIPYIVDIQDLWPEAFQLVLKHMNFLFWGMKKKIDYVYKNARKVIAVSKTYADRANIVRTDSYNSICVYIGTDLKIFDEYPIHSVEKDDNELWIIYIGTLGSSYNIDIVIDAVRLLREGGVNGFSFQVFGDGPKMQEYQEHAAGLPIRFWGRLLYSDLIGYTKNADIAVNPIVKGAPQSIINKHADYAAAGLPVVNTQECKEYRDLLDQYECGINCDVDSVEQVASALRVLIKDSDMRKRMGKNSRRMAEEKFDRSNTYMQIVELVEDVICS